MASWWNDNILKVQVNEIAIRWNVEFMKQHDWWQRNLVKWQADNMSSWRSGKLVAWQVGEIESWWIGKLFDWKSWWIGKLMKWQIDKMMSWWHCKLVKWQVYRMQCGWSARLTKCVLTTTATLTIRPQVPRLSIKSNLFLAWTITLFTVGAIPRSSKLVCFVMTILHGSSILHLRARLVA